MSSSETAQRLRNRDRSARAITTDGNFRAAAIINTQSVAEAQRRHATEPVASLLLGRALSAASLLATFLKGEERVSLELMGNGVYRKVFAEALQVGEVRGYVEPNAHPEQADDAIGIGLLRVTRVLYGKFEPVSGVVALQTSNVSGDLAYYLTQSEQIPSAVRLDVDIDETGAIRHSAGIMVQAMPGVPEEAVLKVQEALAAMGSVTDLAAAGLQVEDILRRVMPGEIEIINKTPIDFFCRCSLERYKSILLTLGLSEIQGMADAKQNELVCHYCNTKYTISDADFEDLLSQLRAQKN
ncbi:MAG: Hsp33 family molecular chaperone HslO [Candidatus Kapaibacterium sp.]